MKDVSSQTRDKAGLSVHKDRRELKLEDYPRLTFLASEALLDTQLIVYSYLSEHLLDNACEGLGSFVGDPTVAPNISP